MNALIQSVEQDLSTGKTVIRFGPPKHLGADDLAELTRTNRNRSAARHSHSRHTGVPPISPIDNPRLSRLDNLHFGQNNYKKLVVSHPSSLETQIVLDPAPLPTPLTVSLREEYVFADGSLQKRFSLASQPFAVS
ncbi:MAG: hypothetical protein A2007_01300 [Verrucomicrobia bacterium GWC2_42_7]|nr:MAG: hypothetical protein A2007_01300 [Verrucomicrobia bacterium GWC2_42_7]